MLNVILFCRAKMNLHNIAVYFQVTDPLYYINSKSIDKIPSRDREEGIIASLAFSIEDN